MSNYKTVKKITEGTEIHGVFVINLVFPPCNSVVNLKKNSKRFHGYKVLVGHGSGGCL